MDEVTNSLRAIDLFSDISEKSLKDIEDRCEWRGFPPGTHILDRMSSSMDVYFVMRGMVRVVNFSESGREISLNDIEAGAFFGELSAIDGLPRSANVVAVYSTSVALMPQEVFWSVIREHASFNKRLLERLTKIVRVSVNRIMDLSTLSAHGRVYSELLQMAQKRPQSDGTGRISPIPIHSELASRISTTRETVARILSELNRRGIVTKERNVLIVHDMKSLEGLWRAQM